MITFWNRKEVYMGMSMQKFAEARDRLIAKGIDYRHRASGNLPYRSGVGSGINMEYAYTYYLYVHRKDYDLACAVVNGMKF